MVLGDWESSSSSSDDDESVFISEIPYAWSSSVDHCDYPCCHVFCTIILCASPLFLTLTSRQEIPKLTEEQQTRVRLVLEFAVAKGKKDFLDYDFLVTHPHILMYLDITWL